MVLMWLMQLGLSGDDPVTFDVDNITAKIDDIKAMKKILLAGKHEIDFDPAEDIEIPYSVRVYLFILMP